MFYLSLLLPFHHCGVVLCLEVLESLAVGPNLGTQIFLLLVLQHFFPLETLDVVFSRFNLESAGDERSEKRNLLRVDKRVFLLVRRLSRFTSTNGKPVGEKGLKNDLSLQLMMVDVNQPSAGWKGLNNWVTGEKGAFRFFQRLPPFYFCSVIYLLVFGDGNLNLFQEGLQLLPPLLEVLNFLLLLQPGLRLGRKGFP